MVAQIENIALDNGLTVINSAVTRIWVNANEPTTFALATTGSGTSQALGYKSFGAGATFGAPGAGAGTSRAVTSASVTDGTITTSGTAGWWAACSESSLYAHGSLASNKAVTSGNSFTLGQFSITIPNH